MREAISGIVIGALFVILTMYGALLFHTEGKSVNNKLAGQSIGRLVVGKCYDYGPNEDPFDEDTGSIKIITDYRNGYVAYQSYFMLGRYFEQRSSKLDIAGVLLEREVACP